MVNRIKARLRNSFRSVINLIVFFVLIAMTATLSTGCEPPKDRFAVSDYQKKNFRKVKNPYQVKSKVKLPRLRSFPGWSDITDIEKNVVFQPEPVKLLGEEWLRSDSKVFSFYFKRTNPLSGRTIVAVADSVAHFLLLWGKRSFSERVHILLVPSLKPKKNQKLPYVGNTQHVIYTGADNDACLSKYGLIGELIKVSLRYLGTNQTKAKHQQFWRSIAIPGYFEQRATGAMVAYSYNKTITPKFRSILQKQGKPSAQEVRRLIENYKKGTLAPQYQGSALRIINSFLGFIEDAYGRKAFGGFLQYMLANPKKEMKVCLETILGVKMSVLWNQWTSYYYVHKVKQPLGITLP